MKKKIIGLCAILLLASGCGTPKLKNGQEAIIKFKNGDMISVDEYYNRLKDSFGLESLITMVDLHILETEFADYVDDAKNNAKAYTEAFVEQYGGEQAFLEALRQNTNYQTIEAYENYLYLSYMQSHAIEEYAKLQITDEDIEKYYKNEAIGDMEVSHILIIPDVKEDASKDEQKKAEDKAKATVNEIIKKLDKAKKEKKDINKTFASLVKEYSKDDATKDKDGSLGKINYNTLSSSYDELITAAAKLKDGEYSTKVITTEIGYHVILKTKTYEKEKLDKLKDDIVKTLGERYAQENEKSIGLTALQYYRKEYGMEITDKELKKQYSNYIQNALASIQNNN